MPQSVKWFSLKLFIKINFLYIEIHLNDLYYTLLKTLIYYLTLYTKFTKNRHKSKKKIKNVNV